MGRMEKATLVRLVAGGLGFCMMLSLLCVLSCVKCGEENSEEVLNKTDNGDTEEKRLIQIAGKAIEGRYGVQTSGFKLFYDHGNKVWKEHYAAEYPNLNGYDYQAIRFQPTGALRPGGGPFWVCVNRKNGEVLVTDVGM